MDDQKRSYTIYALRCPDTGEVRYVGATRNVRKRFGQHCRMGDNVAKTHRASWLMSLLAVGKRPRFSVLEMGLEDYHEAERRWIAHYRATGASLVNGNEGGRTLSQANLAARSNKTRRKRSALANQLSMLARTPNDLRRLGFAGAADRVEATYRRVVARLQQARRRGTYARVESEFEARYG